VINTAAVVDDEWSPPFPLSDAQWEHLLGALALVGDAAAEHGVVQALHPHWGTLVERDADVQRVLADSSVDLCLDTGHLALGGSNAVALARACARRVVHVHLKDVDEAVAARLRAGELDLVSAVRAGLFLPLGAGDARVDDVVMELGRAGYSGWYVLEQDTALLGAGPSAGHAPEDEVRRSIEFLRAIDSPTEGG